MVKRKILISFCAVILNSKVTDPLAKKFADVIEEVINSKLTEKTNFDTNFEAGSVSAEENIRSYFPGTKKIDTWKIIECAKEIRGRVFVDYKNNV